MPSRVRFSLPPNRSPNFDYTFESVSTRSHLSSPSASFDSTLETLHEDSVLECHHSFDSMERVEENEEESLRVIPPIRRPSDRKPLSDTHNRRVEEEKEDKKTKD